jgi:hypothetical protein
LTKILFRISTIDYQARRHELDFVLTPYYDTAKLTFANAQKTLALTYKNTTLELERNNTKTSGLDPGAIRPAMTGFGTNPLADPQMPIASKAEPHLSVDAEGLVANADGTYGNLANHFLLTGSFIFIEGTGRATNMDRISTSFQPQENSSRQFNHLRPFCLSTQRGISTSLRT